MNPLLKEFYSLKKIGKLYKLNNQLSHSQAQFTYADILNKAISYAFEDPNANKDEILFRVFDGVFESSGKLLIKKLNSKLNIPAMEKNEGLNAIAGN